MSAETRAAIDAALVAAGITYGARFVPHSLSRNRDKDKCLNWLVDFKRGGKIYTVEYMQGSGHIPPCEGRPLARNTNDWHANVYQACEEGRYQLRARSAFHARKLPIPSAADVLQCLLLDSTGADQSFENWAADYDYDIDSRAAFKVYEACCATAHEMRQFFGAPVLAEFTTLLQDY